MKSTVLGLAVLAILGLVACKPVEAKLDLVGREQRPGYYTTSFITCGNALVPITTWHGPSFYLTYNVRYDDGSFGRQDYSVSQAEYDAAVVAAPQVER